MPCIRAPWRGYPTPRAAGLVAERLAMACQAPEHAFWAADVSLLAPDIINWSRVLGHRQVTDAYLLALAVRNQGRLVTFDQRIHPAVVVGGSEQNLNLIG